MGTRKINHNHVRQVLEKLGDIIPLTKGEDSNWIPFKTIETFKRMYIYIYERENRIVNHTSIKSRDLYKELQEVRNRYTFDENTDISSMYVGQIMLYQSWFGELLDYIYKYIQIEATQTICITETTDELSIRGVTVGSWHYYLEFKTYPVGMGRENVFIIKPPLGGVDVIQVPMSKAQRVNNLNLEEDITMAQYTSNMTFTNRKGFVDVNKTVRLWVYDNFKRYGNVLISLEDYNHIGDSLLKRLNRYKALRLRNYRIGINDIFKTLNIKKKDSEISKKEKLIEFYLLDLFECEEVSIRHLKSRGVLYERSCVIIGKEY